MNKRATPKYKYQNLKDYPELRALETYDEFLDAIKGALG